MRDEELIVTFPVEWKIRDAESLRSLRTMARELDVENDFDVVAEYTPEQALTVVFHFQPEDLFTHLVGWNSTNDFSPVVTVEQVRSELAEVVDETQDK